MFGQPVECIHVHTSGNGGKAKADCIRVNPLFNMSDWASVLAADYTPC